MSVIRNLPGNLMSDRISATIEDYLSVIYVMARDEDAVTGVNIARLIGVSPPTVTNTLKRMVRDDLVSMDDEHKVHLTPHGLEAAQSVMRRHMLAEWMLARMVSWSKVHKEAHEFEHAISGEVETALLTELNNPEVCPHGNPLPGHEEAVAAWKPLTQAPVNTRLVIRRIHEFAEGDEAVMSFLEENGIKPGQEVVVRNVLDFNQTINVEVAGRVVVLGFAVARYLYVEQKNA